MEFEWFPPKAAENVANHGIDFPTATRVFDDPMMLSEPDPRDYGGEVRLRAIGTIDRRVYLVCYTMRGERYRIISARPASRRERTRYAGYGTTA